MIQNLVLLRGKNCFPRIFGQKMVFSLSVFRSQQILKRRTIFRLYLRHRLAIITQRFRFNFLFMVNQTFIQFSQNPQKSHSFGVSANAAFAVFRKHRHKCKMLQRRNFCVWFSRGQRENPKKYGKFTLVVLNSLLDWEGNNLVILYSERENREIKKTEENL